ncbi:MAG: glycosyltransferase family 87 protein [Bacteroidota bacterium]
MFRIGIPKWIRAALIVLLLAFLVYRGLFPAFTQIDTDFPNYYTAGKVVVSGGEINRLYDDLWFQEQIKANGMELKGKFSPFPPPTALLFVPFSIMTPLAALQVMSVINLFLLAACVIVMGRILGIDRWDSLLLLLLGGIGLVNCFRFGQLYLVLSFTIIFGYYLYTHGKPVLAGIALGLFIPIKYFPIIFLIYFVMKGEWKVVAASSATAFVITIMSVLAMGWEIHELFIKTVLGQHLQSQLTLQDPYSSTFQSFDSLFRRLFMRDGTLNPHPVIDQPFFFHVLKFAAIATVASISFVLVHRLTRGDRRFQGAAFGLLGIAGLLIAPATATYHFILLWLPVGLLLRFFHEQSNRMAFWLTCAVYSAIGFIPYSLFRHFDGQGLWSLFAYPRLALIIGLFGITTYYLGRGALSPKTVHDP